MSFTLPGAAMAHLGTQPIKMADLKSKVDAWGKAYRDGKNGAPTYKSCNKSAAYFYFLKMNMSMFSADEQTAFLSDPDDPKFKDHRKIMILLANILLRDYCDLKIGARLIDYRTVCAYDGVHNDLINLVEGWAKEIDDQDYEKLTEIYMQIDGEKYPIAFYSTQHFVIFPFNTINSIVQDRMIGWDGAKKDYTMAALFRDIAERPMSDRALYAALVHPDAGLGHPVLDTLADWLRNNRSVTRAGGAAYPTRFEYIPIDDTTATLTKLPIAKLPPIPKDKFSEQLLIIQANTNVKNGEFGLCQVANNSIGVMEAGAPMHAVVAPLSKELIESFYAPQDGANISFMGCTVLKNGPDYHVTITLDIDGCPTAFKKVYLPSDVKKCNNFPLISLLTKGKDESTPVRLYRTDYEKSGSSTSPVFLDGKSIKLGESGDSRELSFKNGEGVRQDQFYYSSVGYHDPIAGKSYYCGYLLFEKSGPQSLYSKALASIDTAVIIDEENEIAQIAKVNRLDMSDVTAYNVYNDRILFFSTNGRDDLDKAILNRCWGTLGSTIFSTNDGKYALAPFSKEFAEMVANGDVTISSAPAPVLQSSGVDWIFSVAFDFNGKLMKTAPHVYHQDEQFTMPNPPFFYVVKTVGGQSLTAGYEVIKVANMGTNAVNNTVDSNDLTFKLENKVIQTSLFVTPGANASNVFIHAYNGNDYLGQITLNLSDYALPSGFHALLDDQMSCAVIILIKDKGMNQPKEIITGTVFDDNLFLIVKEPNRAIYTEYQAWRRDDLVVDIGGMTSEQAEGKEYQAVFPFSLRMLQNINNGSIQMVPDSTKITFNELEKRYEVSVSIMNPNAANTCVVFNMNYNLGQGKVVKCDNLPFVIAVEGGQQRGLARFNNDIPNVMLNHIDGSQLNIEVVENGETKLEDGGNIVPINADQVVLRLSTTSSAFGNSRVSCHILYQATAPITDGVFSLQSEETGEQLVIDYDADKQTVTKLDVFTDYVIFTIPMLRNGEPQVFAGGTQCTPATPLGANKEPESRIYSIPVTMKFTDLMERRYRENRGDVRISAYSNVKFQSRKPDGTLCQYVVNDSYDLYVEINIQGLNTTCGPAKISKIYPRDKVIDFVGYELPTLTVFPYVNFVADDSFGANMAGKPLWQKYNYAKFTSMTLTPEKAMEPREHEALGSRVDFWVNGKKIIFKKRKSKLPQLSTEEKEMKVGTVNGWGRYIHMTYDGSADVAPAQAIDTILDKKEFGCIIMDLPTPVPVSANMTATVGVDFGTRNSIIALQSNGMVRTIFPYHGNRELQQVIIPNMFHDEFNELSNYCYIPHFPAIPGVPGGSGCGKFASSIMVYAGVRDPNERILPYDLGFVPNVQGSVLRKIMDGMGGAGTGCMGDDLGFYTDLKVSTDARDKDKVDLMRRNVRTFIKSIMFHTVLNSFQAGCGNINIRFSTPSDSYARELGKVWEEAREYIMDFIPECAHGNIHVGDYATEAAALFEDLTVNMPGGLGGMPKYSAIADGGDGTYDFTINKYEGGKLSTPAGGEFSLRYAGQQIMTDSVNAFYDHLVARNNGFHNANVRTQFRNMWDVDPSDKDAVATLTEMVENLSSFREKKGTDREMEKTLALMLVEQFGIDYSKIISSNPTSLDDYVNPEYLNFVRMIQYKFLFLFNVLGEQIRKTIRLDQENQNSFNVYLFGGTSQALLIAEPLCQGNINVFSGNVSNIPMAMFIDAMLDLPRNVHGEKYGIKFLPAPNNLKLEIARGLIQMPAASLKSSRHANSGVMPNLMAGAAPAAGAATDPFGAAGGLAGFGVAGGLAGFGAGTAATADNNADPRDAVQPQTIDAFIKDLKDILNQRTVKLAQGEVCIDYFLKFLDEKNQQITLSKILDDKYVRAELSQSLTTMWNRVKEENPNIDDSKLLYHIYTLKMVSAAIEVFLRSGN
ncbi:MAG: hypothetical protein K5695_09025 [Oscillospiraceae bacterium]|nr:hypothetical protein [Oscillospiraceae bacterium]